MVVDAKTQEIPQIERIPAVVQMGGFRQEIWIDSLVALVVPVAVVE